MTEHDELSSSPALSLFSGRPACRGAPSDRRLDSSHAGLATAACGWRAVAPGLVRRALCCLSRFGLGIAQVVNASLVWPAALFSERAICPG